MRSPSQLKCFHSKRILLLTLTALALLSVSDLPAEEPHFTGPWNLAELEKVPAAEWSPPVDGIREVRYAGEPFEGKPTRVFAYYGQPEGDGPFPGVVLVHGGGGKAFKDWVVHWVKRGYAAIAMDLAGNGPDGRLPDGGPDQSHEAKFRPFTPETVDNVWTYYAVAAVIRAHSLLADQPAVDKNRIGITGISWGGYLTCIVSGLDRRLKVAVPVYGCGFINEDSAWVDDQFNKMSPEQRDLWVNNFDPSKYLPGVRCPILFITGTNDHPYPLVIHAKSVRLVSDKWRTLTVIPRMPHGHIWTFPEVDTFIEAELKGGQKLLRLTWICVIVGPEIAFSFVTSPEGVKRITKVELHYTQDNGKWPEREWKSTPGQIDENSIRISAQMPEKGYLAYYLSVTDERGLVVSTLHQERKE